MSITLDRAILIFTLPFLQNAATVLHRGPLRVQLDDCMTHSEIVNFLWGIADLIRDTFKRGKYQDVILPLTVLRRLDGVLAPTKAQVLQRQAELQCRGLEDLHQQLCATSGFAFYNTSRYDFASLLADAPELASNLRNYIAGFSPNMREVLERLDFDNTISKLDEGGLLFQVMERFQNVDLHPDLIDNAAMGTLFEELIRRFNEAMNENPGEHFTPRDVVHLMVDLMLAGDEELIRDEGIVRSIYDPCCGSGGMLTIAKEHIRTGHSENGTLVIQPVNPNAEIHLFGQEVNPETWAVSKSDLFMKDPTGRDADTILYGTTLSHDRHAGQTFDYLIANPPYGKDWKRDANAVRAEHGRGTAGRFGPGLPRISDGQLLFLLHMLAHAKDPAEGGSRHRHNHERLSPVHGRRGQRRERDTPLYLRERPAGNTDRVAGAAFLQHRHRHVYLAAHEPEESWAPRQGATHRRFAFLDSHAPQSGRQTPTDTMGESAGYSKTPQRLPGWRQTSGRPGRSPGGNRSKPHLPYIPLRLSQDHRGTASSAQFPSSPDAYRPT